MSGEKKPKGQKTRNYLLKNTEKGEMEEAFVDRDTEEEGRHDAETRSGLENINKEIRCLKSEMKGFPLIWRSFAE